MIYPSAFSRIAVVLMAVSEVSGASGSGFTGALRCFRLSYRRAPAQKRR